MKGDLLGEWVILKKAFTAKMKPRVYFSYEDSSWLKPVSAEVLAEMETYFEEHPDYKKKFDNAEINLPPTITNCWLGLPEEQEQDFRKTLERLPKRYTMNEFWNVAKQYKQYVSKPPATYLLNLSTQPWDLDENANLIYFGWDLIKN